MAAVGFSDLPTEALDEIARRVGPLDNVTCSAVCKPWRRALKTTRLRPLQHPNFPHQVELYGYNNTVKVSPIHYSISSTRSVVVLDDRDEGAPPKRIIGSAYGWAVTVDKEHGLCLVDPLTGRQFPLPALAGKKAAKDLDLLGEDMFHKAALAPGRRLGSYAVLLIHSGGHGLSFLAPGAKSWTTLRAPSWAPGKYMDAVFHKGAFYTVGIDSELNAWVRDGSTAGLRARRATVPRTERAWSALVNPMTTSDELMMVRQVSSLASGPPEYEVSRYDERGGRWLPVEDLGEAAVFVGGSCSVCVSTRGRGSSSSNARLPLKNYLYFARSCNWSSYRHPQEYRLPTATDRWGYGVYSISWFLPYVVPQFCHY
ncbi:unnamed protein product [Alopecurus aequalis]